MSGICAAVNATTVQPASSRNTVLKSWKSRPAAPMMRTRAGRPVSRMPTGAFMRGLLRLVVLEPGHVDLLGLLGRLLVDQVLAHGVDRRGALLGHLVGVAGLAAGDGRDLQLLGLLHH